MCQVNPFPLEPTCGHIYDELDRVIVLFLIESPRGRNTQAICSAMQEHFPNWECGYSLGGRWYPPIDLALRRRRLRLLLDQGWVDAYWFATSKAKEAHQLWLWSNYFDIAV